MMEQDPKVAVLLGKTVSAVGEACPLATKDIKENIKNRDWTIKNFGYGPLNPDAPDPGFWLAAATALRSTRPQRLSTA
jgi:hypothetical protein